MPWMNRKWAGSTAFSRMSWGCDGKVRSSLPAESQRSSGSSNVSGRVQAGGASVLLNQIQMRSWSSRVVQLRGGLPWASSACTTPSDLRNATRSRPKAWKGTAEPAGTSLDQATAYQLSGNGGKGKRGAPAPGEVIGRLSGAAGS